MTADTLAEPEPLTRAEVLEALAFAVHRAKRMVRTDLHYGVVHGYIDDLLTQLAQLEDTP